MSFYFYSSRDMRIGWGTGADNEVNKSTVYIIEKCKASEKESENQGIKFCSTFFS